MKSSNLTAILTVLILLILGACAPGHHHGRMECPMKKEGGPMLQRMADTCANQLASINTTKEILSAASTSKSSPQVKAAITKASDELTRSADLISLCCSHIKMMGEGYDKCGMHKGCGCGEGGEAKCGMHKGCMCGGEGGESHGSCRCTK